VVWGFVWGGGGGGGFVVLAGTFEKKSFKGSWANCQREAVEAGAREKNSQEALSRKKRGGSAREVQCGTRLENRDPSTKVVFSRYWDAIWGGCVLPTFVCRRKWMVPS